MTHKHRLIGKGLDPKIAEEMADPTGERAAFRAALREAVLKWAFIIVSAVALWVVGARWAEVKAADTIEQQAKQIEQLERMVVGCLEYRGFHLQETYFQCSMREVRK